jgi:uncharacterized protein (TIGR02147 family)
MRLFDEDNYKQIVRKRVASLPGKGRGEWAKIARHLGISTTLVSQIFNGEKELTPEQALALCKYWGWDELETDYFVHLVYFTRAGSEPYRQRILRKLSEMRKASEGVAKRLAVDDHELSEEGRTLFYSDRLYMAVWIFSSIPSLQNFDLMADRLSISRARLREIVDFLTRHQICVEDGDRLLTGPTTIHLKPGSPLVARHHTNWRLKAIEKSELLSEEELMFTAPISVSEADFGKLRQLVVDLVSAAAKIVKDSKPEISACMNFDLFKW